MPFHIEISSPFGHARVLNVDEAELRKEVLDFWVAGLPFKFRGQDWEPRESRLTILEGPEIESEPGAEDDWQKALRAADDVTRQMLEAAEASAPTRIAVVVEADSVETALRDLRSGRAPQQIPWAAAVERIGGNAPDVTALILVVKRPEIGWLEL
jgi:hypothetical protein